MSLFISAGSVVSFTSCLLVIRLFLPFLPRSVVFALKMCLRQHPTSLVSDLHKHNNPTKSVFHLQSLHSYKSNIFFLSSSGLSLFVIAYRPISILSSFVPPLNLVITSLSSLSFVCRYGSNLNRVFSCRYVRSFGLCCILAFHCASSLSLILSLTVLLHSFASLDSNSFLMYFPCLCPEAAHDCYSTACAVIAAVAMIGVRLV